MNSTLLDVRDITHSFSGSGEQVKALKGITFQANAGETTAIVGPSGCGKSTLMYLLGLLDIPDSGEILINNKRVSKLSDLDRTKLRNETIGFIFQFHFLIKELSVVENVALPAQKKGLSQKKAFENALDILSELGLEAKASRMANKLSGGEQQRVAIARALINSPSLVLADEPTGNLDTANSERVFKLLHRLSKDQGLAVLLVTHNLDIAARCDHSISMKDGIIVT